MGGAMEIKFFKPGLPDWDAVKGDIEETYRNGILYPGKYTLRLEEMFRNHFGTKYAIAVNNCSNALILLMCDLPSGSKVIMPSYTFRATSQAAEWNNLRIVLTDVDDSGYLDPESLYDCVKKHPDARCVMPVNLWGNCTNVEQIKDICAKAGMRLIYDSAHGMSTKYDGKPIGDLGDAVAFSIAVTKPLACGEGSIVATNSDHLGKIVEKGRLHGNVFGDLDCVQKGLNAKIGEINSILAIHGMKILNDCRDGRELLAKTYMAGLRGLPISFQTIDPRCVTSRKDFGMWVEDKKTRDRLKIFLEQSGIGVKTYFSPAVHQFSNFEGIVHKVDVSERLSNTCINLPCYDKISESEALYIISKITEFYR
jgi:UDP-2-acetamido-2-deoxy-ribo-hexuluronate aminotransferase